MQMAPHVRQLSGLEMLQGLHVNTLSIQFKRVQLPSRLGVGHGLSKALLTLVQPCAALPEAHVSLAGRNLDIQILVHQLTLLNQASVPSPDLHCCTLS